MPKVAIGMTHGHTPKWLQVILHSLKTPSNEAETDIYVACSWPEHPSIRAGSDCSLGEGVTFIPCSRRLHSHATGLEHILEHVWDKGYDYLFCCETDCAALKDGWLDWFVRHIEQDPLAHIGLAGFFWDEQPNHYNINPSGTLYDMRMLKHYHTEVRENMSPIFWHPAGNKHDCDGGMDPSIKEVAGVFAETRGIEHPNEEQLECIRRGVPQASWWEPGAWLYVRSRGEWGEARVPVDHVYTEPGLPEGTYYGGKADPYFMHWWGGTRAYDFLKHPVTDNFVLTKSRGWLAREDRIWRSRVPEELRAPVHDLICEAGTLEKMEENLGFVIPEGL